MSDPLLFLFAVVAIGCLVLGYVLGAMFHFGFAFDQAMRQAERELGGDRASRRPDGHARCEHHACEPDQ